MKRPQHSEQREHIIEILPRLVYHYADPDADDAVTVTLRHLRARIDTFARGGHVDGHGAAGL